MEFWFATGGFAMLLAAESQHYIELRRENNEEIITQSSSHKEQLIVRPDRISE